MRIINKKYLLMILLVGVILTCVIMLKPKENIKLDKVILKQEVNSKTFAMYKEESENNYAPVEGTEFPKMYVLNLTESKCIDNNGNEIKDALSYENDEVVLTTNKTVYCYLYFDKSLGLQIKEKTPKGLSTDKERGAMYRFQGQARDENGNELVDNYICFGTSDKDECIKDTDHYMYRIIGIEAETGRVKVIKKEALNTTSKWWDNYDEDIDFPNSRIYETISGSGFLKNSDYVLEGWEEKISTNTWMYGDMHSNNTTGARQNGEGLYLAETGQKGTFWDEKAKESDEDAKSYIVGYENSPYHGQTIFYIRHNNENWTKTFESKVSLMYIHDYHYSVSDEANCQADENNYGICQTGWMHLSQNDAEAPNEHEWTMTRSGWDIWSGYFNGHIIVNVGEDGGVFTIGNYSIRPVFYIDASQKIIDGLGTIDNPYIIQ